MSIDDRLIDLIDRVVCHFQKAHGLSLPLMLREVTMAAMVSLLVLPFAQAWDGHTTTAALLAPFVLMALPGLRRWLTRYTRDAAEEWSEGLSRRYLAMAQSHRIAYGPVRLLLLVAVVLAGWLAVRDFARGDGLALSSAAFLLQTGFAALCHYLQCATPQTPGRRRRQALTLAPVRTH